MIHVVNALRANLLRREIEDKVLDSITPKLNRWGSGVVPDPKMYMVGRLLRRFERIRMQRWALWKDRR